MLLTDVSPHLVSSYHASLPSFPVIEASATGELATSLHGSGSRLNTGFAEDGSAMGWFWLAVCLFIVWVARPPKSLLDDAKKH